MTAEFFSISSRHIQIVMIMEGFSSRMIELLSGLLEDKARYHEVETAEYPPDPNHKQGWSSAGAPTIFFDNATGDYYVSLRQRAPQATGSAPSRGYKWEMFRKKANDLLTPWTKVWELKTSDVAGKKLASVEGVSLRKYEDAYHYYFCWTDASTEWMTGYVVTDSIDGIRTELKNSGNWQEIMKGKDPKVMKFENKYYMVISNSLIESDSPCFLEYNILMDRNFHEPYSRRFGIITSSTGPIFYDEDLHRYVYWGNSRHEEEIYWYTMTSKNLKDWSLDWRKNVFNWGYSNNNTARYFDLSITDEDIVFCMEWDHNKDFAGSTFVWQYENFAGDRDMPKNSDLIKSQFERPKA